MDFDIAARRLQKDQQSALARSRASRNARTATAKAKREAALARQKAEKRLREKKLESERNARITDAIARGVRRVERDLGVTDVGSSSSSSVKTDVVVPPAAAAAAVAANPDKSSLLFANSPLSSGWTFGATSIHGDGDKIALPPSVLETMTSNANDLDPWGSGRSGRPIAFRIGILNPDYAFPSSDKMRALVENARQEVISSEKIELAQKTSSASEFSNDGSTNEDMDDDEANDSQITEAYLDELSHRYLSYTHGTVVEFTQENECVGLPEPIARALLQPNSHSLVGGALSGRKNHIPMKRTVDPAPSAVKSDVANDESNVKSDANDAMDVDTPNNRNDMEDVDTSERTPGHPAYGLFDVPALPIEVTPVNSLRPGNNCTFTPTASSIKNGFYSLKDVKSVLEQSLMRTRATLSRGDIIRTWRRGVSFDLIVSSLTPTEYGAVSCINTNLNVDIGPPEGEGDATSSDVGNDVLKPATKTTNPMGGGRLLSEPSSPTKSQGSMPSPIDAAVESIVLPPEPATNVKEGVCNIQIRGRTPSGNSAAGRRRFDTTTAIMSDLFAFASQVCDGLSPTAFRLVTRFPRRVFRVASSDGVGDDCFAANATLESAGIGQGQEMFMVETV
mmetsp:Transcript_24613/g.53329  ORF Transcript_24613/g.53329 Transcript_24613/m.53329 type:complete len:621 (-) Transcript_24613:56-1918(-)